MYGHLGEMHVGQAEVAVEAAQVHRRDVPLQVCPDVGAVGEVLHAACRADIDDRWHRHVAGLQHELVYVTARREVDVEGLRGIALGKVFGQIGRPEPKHVLAAQ